MRSMSDEFLWYFRNDDATYLIPMFMMLCYRCMLIMYETVNRFYKQNTIADSRL